MNSICNLIKDKNININDSFRETSTNNFINKIIVKYILEKINLNVIKYYNTIYKESEFSILKIFPLKTLINKNYDINNIILLIHINRPNKTHYFILYLNVFIYLKNFNILVKECKISGINMEDKLSLKMNTKSNNYCEYNKQCNVLLTNTDSLLNLKKKQDIESLNESKKKCIGKNSKTKFDCISYGPNNMEKGEWK